MSRGFSMRPSPGSDARYVLTKVRSEAVNGTNIDTNQSGYFATYEGLDGNLYAAWHTLAGPLSLNKINPETLETVETIQLVDKTNDVYNIVVNGNNLFTTTRTVINGTVTILGDANNIVTTPKMSVLACAFAMPDEAGSIQDIDLGDLDPNQPLVMAKGGDTYQIHATVIPATAVNNKLLYTSSNEGVVKVDANGLITADKHGEWSAAPGLRRAPAAETATITVTSSSNPNIKQSFTVRVDNPTAITDITENDNEVSVEGNTIKAGSQPVVVYNMLGQRVTTIAAGECVNLPTGLYIAAGTKVVVK